MESHTLKVLEFDEVLRRIASFSSWPLGREQVLSLAPLSSIKTLERRQEEVAETARLFGEELFLPLGGIRDIREEVSLASMRAMLNPSQLLDVAQTVVSSRHIKNFLLARSELCPLLSKMADAIPLFPEIEKEVGRCIEEDAQVKDSASQRLQQIRSVIKSAHQRIQDRLSQILRSPTYSKMLQEGIITTREDRYVLAVKQECRSQFPGLVIDQSASGVTVFMEPWLVVELGNDLRQNKLSEKKEVEAILARISALVGESGAEIGRVLEILAHLDMLSAVTRYASEMGCIRPELDRDGHLTLEKARHPLLSGEVVPIDIEVGGLFNILVVTGPNTGGKTVGMKTAGLLSLMALSGLPIPAGPKSRVPLYRNIFADIGDEQSISQNLSTFSSHMTRIIAILAGADRDSLVLLDEIGAGTDPVEGTSLAIAILEHLKRRGARVIASTHYSELKSYAAGTSGIMNAAVEFDVRTLEPTYRLLMGIPGRSCAIEIASRLGLPGEVLNEARSRLPQGTSSVDLLLQQVETEKASAVRSTQQAERARGEADRLTSELSEKLAVLKEEEAVARRRIRMEAGEIVEDARDEVKELVRVMRSSWDLFFSEAKETLRKAQEALEQEEGDSVHPAFKELAKALKNTGSFLESESRDAHRFLKMKEEEIAAKTEPQAPAEKKVPAPGRDYLEGERVLILSHGREGVVMERHPDGIFTVQAGVMKLKVPAEGLAPAPDREAPSQAVEMQISKASNVSQKIDLRGYRADEALAALDKYIDDATLADLHAVQIVHGKGQGILRKVIHQYLESHPSVRDFRLGELNEGGWGVTVVTL
ncbi:MAG: Smr/MutS family protein [bacterium]